MSVDIILKDIEWDGVNKIRVPLEGGGTQDFSIGGGSANLQTKSKTYTPTTSQQTDTVSPDSGYDGLSSVNVTVNAVPTATISDSGLETLYIPSQQRKWRARGYIDFGTGGFVSGTQYTPYSYYNYIASGTTVTPTESQQTIGGADTILQDAVTVDAIPSNYVGTGITRRDDDDIQGIEDDPYYTVYVPAGYYPNSAQHDAPIGTEGTPTATKGAVSNHSVSVTPSVTNVKGYIVGGTHSGTAVSVSASELVSGTKSITANGTGIDVTNYEKVNVSVPTGTPTLQTKSATYTPTTSQQTDTITPDTGYDGLDEVDITINAVPTGSVTMPSSITTSGGTAYYTTQATLVVSASATATPDVTTAGYISSGTSGTTSLVVATTIPTVNAQTLYPSTTDQTIPTNRYTKGTQTFKAVTYSADLIASNIKNGVTIEIGDADDPDRVLSVTGTYSGGTSTCDTKTMTNDDNQATSIQFTGLSGQPKWFFVRCTSQLSRSSSYSYYFVTAVRYNGTNHYGNYYRRSNGTFYNDTAHYSHTYSNGTLTVSSSANRGAAGGSFYNGNYELVYIY